MASQAQFLVTQEQYLKSGIHIGTKFRSKYMQQFIYKTRSDGLSVLNLQKIDERIALAAKFLSNYAPEDVLIVCIRDNGWTAVRAFSKYTGIRAFTGRYPPGILTNLKLSSYVKAKLLFTVDAWPDRNAIEDANKMGIPVMSLCDTNNHANNLDFILPCNNKGKKSLGLLFWIIAKEYLLKRGVIKNESEFKAPLEEFTGE